MTTRGRSRVDITLEKENQSFQSGLKPPTKLAKGLRASTRTRRKPKTAGALSDITPQQVPATSKEVQVAETENAPAPEIAEDSVPVVMADVYDMESLAETGCVTGLVQHVFGDPEQYAQPSFTMRGRPKPGRARSEWETGKLKECCDVLKTVRAEFNDLLDKRQQMSSKATDFEKLVNENLKSKSDACSALESEVASLQSNLEAATQRCATVEAQLFDKSAANEELTAEVSQLRDDIVQLQQQLSAVSQALTDEQVAHAEVAATLEVANEEKEKLQEQLTDLQAQKSAYEKETAGQIAQLQTNLSTLTSQRDDFEKQVQQLNTNAQVMQAEKQSLERDAAVARENERKTTEDIAKLEAQLAQKEQQVMETFKHFTESQKMQAESQKEIAETRARFDGKIKELQESRDELHKQLATANADHKEAARRTETLEEQLTAATAKMTTLETTATQATEQLQAKVRELELAQVELNRLRIENGTVKDEWEAKVMVATGKCAVAEEKYAEMQQKQAEWEAEKETFEAQLKERDEAAGVIKQEAEEMRAELATMRESCGTDSQQQLQKLCDISREADTLRRRVSDMDILKMRLEEAENRIATLQQENFDGEMCRRKLHNTIQELKGNIRVFVRIRPFLPHEQRGTNAKGGALVTTTGASVGGDPTPSACIQCHPDKQHLEIDLSGGSSSASDQLTSRKGRATSGLSHGFGFDHVFGQEAAQQHVFDEVNQFVQSALDGYSVCLFSYGQTGSGKTFTMQGSHGDDAGLIPRSVNQILETAQEMGAKGWSYNLEASFLEIYNENVRDLLRPSSAPPAATSLAIKQPPAGAAAAEVVGLTRSAIEDAQTVETLLARAQKARSVASTNMNAESSRSHSVFTLYITGRNEAQGVEVAGALNLVDLAGSERVHKSGAEGDRLKEAAAINKSLSCLGDVFMAIGKGQKHVPFRNSKLTYLLQPCFSGDGKTLMMVNLSPHASSAQESLCSLRFAAKVNQVELGRPQKRLISSTTAATPVAGVSTPCPADGSSTPSAGSDGQTPKRRGSISASPANNAAVPTPSSMATPKPGARAEGTAMRRKRMSMSTTSATGTSSNTIRRSNTGVSSAVRRPPSHAGQASTEKSQRASGSIKRSASTSMVGRSKRSKP